jgi:integrase
MAVAEVKEAHVRRWRKNLLAAGVSTVTAAKAYRLLKAIFNTAVDDGLIRRNPCRIKGAGQEKSPERASLTVPQVYALAEAIDQRYRALVLLGTFGSLRWGELAALRRADIDLATCMVRVERQLTETLTGAASFGPPKSDAGVRLVPFPDMIAADLRWHLQCFAQADDDVLIFTSPGGTPLRHSNFYRRAWLKAVEKAGLGGVHFQCRIDLPALHR